MPRTLLPEAKYKRDYILYDNHCSTLEHTLQLLRADTYCRPHEFHTDGKWRMDSCQKPNVMDQLKETFISRLITIGSMIAEEKGEYNPTGLPDQLADYAMKLELAFKYKYASKASLEYFYNLWTEIRYIKRVCSYDRHMKDGKMLTSLFLRDEVNAIKPLTIKLHKAWHKDLMEFYESVTHENVKKAIKDAYPLEF